MQQVQEKVERLYATLPGQVNGLDHMERYSASPIFRFLKWEIGVMSKLLKKVRSDLISLKEMCEGKSKSTNEIRELSKDIYNDTIPKLL